MKFIDFCHRWHLGGSGSMENTPTGCGRDLLTILFFCFVMTQKWSQNSKMCLRQHCTPPKDCAHSITSLPHKQAPTCCARLSTLLVRLPRQSFKGFQFYHENPWFVWFCRRWHLGGFGSMENTPTGVWQWFAYNSVFVIFFKNDSKMISK